MASSNNNHGFPPPPPPPPYLYGAPSQGTHSNNGLIPPSSYPTPNSPAQHHAQPPAQSIMHFSNPQSVQHPQLPPASSYSYSQYQYYQPSTFNYHAQYYYQQTPYYTQGSSCAQTPQPPPPPPPPPRSNITQQRTLANTSPFKGPNNNKFDDKESSSRRRSLPSPTGNTDPPKKKINDKMVQKYGGRGLKTITISGPGLRPQKFKICVGNHPDDVRRWIDERKRRFPRRQDGSHGNNNHGGKVEEGGRMISEASAGCKRSRHDANERNVDQNVVQSYVVDTKELVGGSTTFRDEAGSTSRYSRLSSLLEGYDSSSSEDDENSESKRETTATDHPTIEPPLEKNESFMKRSTSTTTAAVETSPSNPKRICKYYQRGRCRHGDSCKFLHSNQVIGNSPRQRQNQTISLQGEKNTARNRYDEEELKMLGLAVPVHGKRRCFGGEKVISSTSLLQKLLQRDKERERRLTLQLIRYIVDCDYFQDGDTKESYCDSDGVGDTRTTDEANLDLK